MALKPSKLKQIPQRNKDLAFGYLRENEEKTQSNYPQLIKYLVLVYSNAEDHFDPNMTHKLLKIEGNRVIHKRHDGWGHRLSFLRNVVSEGINVWKFRFNSNYHEAFSQVGIWKTKSDKPSFATSIYIDNTNQDDISCTGYIITLHGRQSDPQNVVRYKQEWFRPAVKDGDIIEMILDLNKLVLIFKINNVEKVKFEDIENTSYRAALATYREGEKFTLISYQDIYT